MLFWNFERILPCHGDIIPALDKELKEKEAHTDLTEAQTSFKEATDRTIKEISERSNVVNFFYSVVAKFY